MAGDVPHYVWATCEVEHEKGPGWLIPAWLEWYRVGFEEGAWVKRLRGGSRGVYTWSVQGNSGDGVRWRLVADSGFASVPAALEFARAMGWMHNIRVLREWSEEKPTLDGARTA